MQFLRETQHCGETVSLPRRNALGKEGERRKACPVLQGGPELHVFLLLPLPPQMIALLKVIAL